MPHRKTNELLLICFFILWLESYAIADAVPTLPDSTVVKIKALLISNESMVLKLYKDTEGNATIGVGRNLQDIGISQAEAMMLFEDDITRVTSDCFRNFPWFEKMNETRKIVLISMVFNMGINGVLAFHRMLNALAVGNYILAAREMGRSAWARQVKHRATYLSSAMKSGILKILK